MGLWGRLSSGRRGNTMSKLAAKETDKPVPSETHCDAEVFDKLADHVAAPEFLTALERARGAAGEPLPEPLELQELPAGQAPAADGPTSSAGPSVIDDYAGPGSSQEPEAEADGTYDSGSASTSAPSDDGFVVVNRDDAVNSMAYYLALCLMRVPEAQTMEPKRLQEAVVLAMRGMRQSKFKQLWTYGRHAYRWTALTYSALQMYQNPWLIQAVLATIMASVRLAPGIVRLVW